MDISNISGEDWANWRTSYPRAYQELFAASLRGEERALTAELTRTPMQQRRAWIEYRLADFKRCRGEG